MNHAVRIKRLNDTIKKNGYLYKLIERTESKAIYAQNQYGFEVFKIKQSKPHPKAEEDLKNYDKVEVFPNDEDFGTRAWTYRDLELAQKRYEAL